MRNFDQEECAKIKAEPWQIELLNLNPEYTCWGPHEDAMTHETGWSGRKIFPTWKEFGPWGLDELNECVNFYFSVERESKECRVCNGNGYHAEAQEVVNSFYAHMNQMGIHWNDNITQDELEALVKEGRIKEGVTLDQVNSENQPGHGMMGHDCINRHILYRARLKRLGLKETCDCCEGRGYIYTAPSAHVSLTLWMLHPRKGCSRGIEVSKVEQSELPEIFQWLRAAATRNAERFSKI